MVMDEAGRNGGNWHLAQQIVQPVIRYVLSSVTFQQQITYHVTLYIFQQFTQLVIKPHIMQLSMTQPVTFTWFYL